MKKIVAITLTGIIAVTQSGCSMVAPHQQRLSVMSSEADSEIFINGQYAGKGCAALRVPRNQNAAIMVKKEGFKTERREILTTMSAWGIIDIFGGWAILFPFIGLLFPGSRKLDSDNVTIVMDKINPPGVSQTAPASGAAL